AAERAVRALDVQLAALGVGLRVGQRGAGGAHRLPALAHAVQGPEPLVLGGALVADDPRDHLPDPALPDDDRLRLDRHLPRPYLAWPSLRLRRLPDAPVLRLHPARAGGGGAAGRR